MSVHGNEYHDPDFEQEGIAAALVTTHEGKTTGIHGVGASSVESASGSQAKVDTHEAKTTGVHGAGSNYLALAPAAAHLVRSFTKGWTSGKLLKGGGVSADPTEISAWETLAETVVGSDSDYVEFTGLDINTDKMYFLVINVINPNLAESWLYLYRNADNTATNYYTELLIASNSTVSAGRYNASFLTNAGAQSSAFAIAFVVRDHDGYMLAQGNFPRSRGSTVNYEVSSISSSNTTTNISSLRIAAANAGAIGAGSIFILCKPRTA